MNGITRVKEGLVPAASRGFCASMETTSNGQHLKRSITRVSCIPQKHLLLAKNRSNFTATTWRNIATHRWLP